jgi:iduronate 2-sulfatase
MFKKLLTCLLVAMAVGLHAQDKKLNVLFVVVDDLRPELSCYGNTVIKTPNFDRLAKRGMVFNRAYCQQAVCSPSRASIMTGKRPDATRVWDLETHFRTALPDAVSLGQFFIKNGYYSQGMGKIFHGGFDDAACWSTPWGTPEAPIYSKKENNAALEDRKNSGAEKVKGPAFEAGDVADDFYTDGKTARLAVKTISELKQKGQPFFLAVGFSKPHLPFVSPKKYWDMYDADKLPDTSSKYPEGSPIYANDSDSGELHSYTNIPPKEKKQSFTALPDQLTKDMRHGYYAAISYTDANLGLVLDALEKEGLADSTVIVLWGDHGWKLGDHQEWGKHTNFEVDARAPLIISYPGMKNANAKSDSLVEFVDVYPTLADLCGLPKPDTDGVSLRAVLENPTVKVKEVALSQYPKANKDAAALKDGYIKGGKCNVMGYSIRDERWRLILWRGIEDNKIYDTELYDEVNAPTEPVNLANKPENKAVIERLSKFLPPAITAPNPNAVAIGKGKKNKLVDVAAKNKDEDTTFPGVPTTAPAKAAKTPEELAADFKKADGNKDGKISKEEFLAARKKDPVKAEKSFIRYDADKSGDISESEYVKAAAVPAK